jgi:K+-transporting ATPase A subunit
MNISGWMQLVLFIALLLPITKPLGLYLCQVLDVNGRTFLDPVVRPFEKLTYRLFSIDPEKEQSWIHRCRHISGIGDALRDLVDWNNTACRRAYFPAGVNACSNS